jgi:two-component system, NtrC family, sensor kinase
LQVGGSREELMTALDLSPTAIDKVRAELPRFVSEALPPTPWLSPANLPLLPDLLRLALENRRLAGPLAVNHLQVQVDALHQAAARQRASEDQRLQQRKLHAMAELAAGAGHEINNPLAVISGQAQYLLLSEQESARCKALQTIVGQTQRIHHLLTGLMQFARPPAPRKQPIDLAGLVRDVLGSLQTLADERQVQLQVPELVAAPTVLVDPGQMRTMLTALLRNAIEAAPAAGWVRLQMEHRPCGGVTFVVEDSGPGPTTTDREHLFDPFYSGRKAGRGRGLGLSTAWQLARQHNGEIRFDGDGPTRFLLVLPAEAVCAPGEQGALATGERASTPPEHPPKENGVAHPPLPVVAPDVSTSPGLALLTANRNGISPLG